MRALLPILALAGCASTGVGTLRFKNEAAVLRVADRQDIAQPADRPFTLWPYFLDAFAARRVSRLLSIPAPARAADVNALDEVPDSTWFTNRIGVRDLSVDELRHAARPTGSAAPAGPWHVVGGKIGGASPGFVVTDGQGEKFLMKFDVAGTPEMETGADVVVQKLLWTIGYNTPDDSIVAFRRDEIQLAPDAKVADAFGSKRPMTDHDLDVVLGACDRQPDGSYRALVGRYLSGSLIGGYAGEGVRDDDPNDRIAHEERRSLRGQSVFFAWLDHTDVKDDNTLDAWVTDPADAHRHYVVHYLVDFGMALGRFGWELTPSDGFADAIDFEYFGVSLATLGLWRRPWEGADGAPIRGVGRFESDRFDPFGWHSRAPYVPFARSDDFDGFWAAKIIMRFRPEQLRAAVEEGRYSDPAAVDYLTRVLVERQRKIGRAWFERVDPLDGFRMTNGALCFDDLLLEYFPEGQKTRYAARSFGFDGQPTGWHVDLTGGVTTCVPDVRPGPDHDGYLIIEIGTDRDGQELAPVRVHLARDPQTHELRVIGIRRASP